jgi:septum site-determining protein MinC
MQEHTENIHNFVINTDIDSIKNTIQTLALGNHTGVILDIQNPDFAVSDLPLLIELFAQKQFVVIGVRSVSKEITEFATFSNLAIFNTTTSKEISSKPTTPTPYAISKKPSIIRGNIAKGEQVFAKNCDLIIIDDLLDNAEAMSDENITIYGGGYGKVFAGIKNKHASIFVNYFQLKLVCIGGIYKKFDTIPKEYFNQTIFITLIDEKLNFKIL